MVEKKKGMDINKTLEKAPAMIAKLENDAEESRFIWKNAEIAYKQLEAKTHLGCKAKDPDLTVQDLRAKVDEDQKLYEKRMECHTYESAYKKALINVKKWENAFTSARKIASLRMEEMRSLNDVVVRKHGGG